MQVCKGVWAQPESTCTQPRTTHQACMRRTVLTDTEWRGTVSQTLISPDKRFSLCFPWLCPAPSSGMYAPSTPLAWHCAAWGSPAGTVPLPPFAMHRGGWVDLLIQAPRRAGSHGRELHAQVSPGAAPKDSMCGCGAGLCVAPAPGLCLAPAPIPGMQHCGMAGKCFQHPCAHNIRAHIHVHTRTCTLACIPLAHFTKHTQQTTCVMPGDDF